MQGDKPWQFLFRTRSSRLGTCARVQAIRDLATETARLRPAAQTLSNREESDHGPSYPANFTKGLAHVTTVVCWLTPMTICFCRGDQFTGPQPVRQARAFGGRPRVGYHCTVKETCHGKVKIAARVGESARRSCLRTAGRRPGAVGMAPAPRVGSSELAAEMAEL